MDTRIEKALELAIQYGRIDGDHHKAWVIDQMVRALTGCPMEKKETKDCNGVDYDYDAQSECDEYIKLVKDTCDGKDGPDTYDWDVGIAP